MTDPKPYVLVKGTGGLGNRMLSVMTASLFAETAKRRLLIDWRDPIFTGRSGTAPDLFQELFTSPLVDPLPDTIEAKTVAPDLWRDRLNETLAVVGRDFDPLFYKKFGSFRQLAISLRRNDYPEDLIVFWSWREVMRPLRKHLCRMDSRYRQMTNLQILREAAQKYVKPCDRITQLVDQFVQSNFRPNMLGLHIRSTDLQAPVEKLLSLASRVAKERQCEGVFVATDNGEVETRARQMLPNVVTLPKKLPKGAIPLHYDPECQDRIETASQALVDMLLLSRCPTLVYASRSSFAYVASLYAPEGQILLDVDRMNPKIQFKRFAQSWVY